MSIDARFSVENVATLVIVLSMLKCQELGDNEGGAQIIVTKDLIAFIFIHFSAWPRAQVLPFLPHSWSRRCRRHWRSWCAEWGTQISCGLGLDM